MISISTISTNCIFGRYSREKKLLKIRHRLDSNDSPLIYPGSMSGSAQDVLPSKRSYTVIHSLFIRYSFVSSFSSWKATSFAASCSAA